MTVENTIIYMDNSATTPVRKEVVEEMIPYLTEYFGNPSSIYDLGKTSKNAVGKARQRVAEAIGSVENEIYFTSGGTESDNWAIKGIAFANRNKGTHIIIPLSSTMQSCKPVNGWKERDLR